MFLLAHISAVARQGPFQGDKQNTERWKVDKSQFGRPQFQMPIGFFSEMLFPPCHPDLICLLMGEMAEPNHTQGVCAMFTMKD